MTHFDGISNDTTSFSNGSTVSGGFAQFPVPLGLARS